jgi:hypothetical protein
MHDILSRNQLAEWRHFECTLDRCNEELDLVNDYLNAMMTRQHVNAFVVKFLVSTTINYRGD